MADTRTLYTANGTTRNYTVTFPFISRDHVNVKINLAEQLVGVNFTWVTDSTIRFTQTPPEGAAVVIKRKTPQDTRLVDFQNGATLTEAELDLSATQLFYLTQEINENYAELIDGALVRIANNNGVFNTEGDDVIQAILDSVLSTALAIELQQSVTDIQLNAEAIINQANLIAKVDQLLQDVEIELLTLTGSYQTQIDLTTQQATDLAQQAADLVTEANTRATEYTSLLNDILAEITERENADAIINNNIVTLQTDVAGVDSGVASNTSAINALDTRVTTTENSVIASATDITALQADVTNLTTGATGSADAITALDTRVTSNEVGITSTASDITSLQATVTTNSTTNATALNGLSTRVDVTESSTTSNSNSITALAGDVTNVETGVSSNTSAISSLDTRVTSNEVGITSVASDVVGLQTSVTDNANDVTGNTTAINALDTRVTTSETGIVANASDITSLQASVTDNANNVTATTTALNALDTRVTSTENSTSANASDITVLNTSVTNTNTNVSTNSSGLTSLDTRVTATESATTVNSTDITSLQADLTDVGSDTTTNTNAVNALDTRVTSTESGITANSSDITSLQTTTTNNTSGVTSNTSAVNALTTRVTTTEAGIVSNSSDITSLETGVTNVEAGVTSNTSAVNVLDTRVTTNENSITSNASDVTALESSLTASFTDPRIANGLSENGILTIERPIGASYSASPGVTGAFKITLPQSWTSTMMRMVLEYYDYSVNRSFTVDLGGYTNAGGGGYWLNCTAQMSGRDHPVRFGHDGVKCCIIIGNVNSTWAYPKAVIRNFQAGFTNFTLDQWDDGWDISLITTLPTNIDATFLSPKVADITATSSAHQALDTRVTSNETSISTSASDITQLQSEITATSVLDLISKGSALNIQGNSIEKTVGSNSWNAGAYSTQSFQGAAVASFKVLNPVAMMLGLSTNPTLTSSFTGITHAWYIAGGVNAIVYESGASRGVRSSSVQVGDIFSVEWDGDSVKYYQNGLLKYTSSITPLPLDRFYLDSSFSTITSHVSAVTFTSGSTSLINTSSAVSLLDTRVTSTEGINTAQASEITQLTSSVNGNTSSVTSLSTTVNGLEAQYGVALDVNGYVTGFQQNNNGTSGDFIVLADNFSIVSPGETPSVPFSVQGGITYMQNVVIGGALISDLTVSTLTNGTLDADVNVGTGNIIFDTGTYIKVQGIGFGSSNQFIEWFGPKIPLTSMTESNAISYVTTNGDAYFGGSLTAGTLTTSRNTTDLATDAEIIIGPYGTNGNDITVTMSYAYKKRVTQTGTDYAVNTNSSIPNAVVKLYQRIGSGTELLLGTYTFNGGEIITNAGGEPGVPSFHVQNIGGGITFTDTTGGTLNRTYRAEMVSRANINAPGSILEETQKLTLTSTEE